MSINVLLTLVEQYKEAAQLIEAAQAEQEQLKIQIREALAATKSAYPISPAPDWTAKPSRP